MYIQSLTDIGRTRQENQDNYWSAVLNVDDTETGIVCMCDGMGGLSNGGLASSILVKSVRESILDGVDFSELKSIILQSNKAIYSLSTNNSRMGTTCTILCCSENKYKIYHVGDSRCYKISDNYVRLLSNDHSVINQYGITKEKNADLYEKYKSKLTRCIGIKEDVIIDEYSGEYKEGDIFLLCSDGFWHYYEEVGYCMDLQNLKCCVNDCMRYGETDNISVSLLHV